MKHLRFHHILIGIGVVCVALVPARLCAQQPTPPAQTFSAQNAPAPLPAPVAVPLNPPQAIGTAPRTIGALPREMSVWSMFMAADIIVKIVMCGLAFASLVTWTIFIAKSVELAHARRRLRKALFRTKGALTMAEAQLALGKHKSIMSAMLVAAVHEAKASAPLSHDSSLKERVASSISEIVRAHVRVVRRGTGLLATIGSTAPFVGLFGTVWGIMNSFIGISKTNTTNLAVVAPGIAEALLATAIGLVAAIPAVIIYNHFSRATRSYLDLVARASGVTTRLLSRDLDWRDSGAIARAAE